MPNKHMSLDRIFSALADPTRRSVLQRLSTRPARVSDLAEPFDMALSSFMQHLDVLEDCGLVRSQKTGRVRTYELRLPSLRAAEKWLAKHRTVWETRLEQLDDYLITMEEQTR